VAPLPPHPQDSASASGAAEPDSILALAERLAADMARRWRKGERPRVEEYLAEYPQLRDQPEAALELISEEIYLRHESGQDAPAEEWLGRFPAWRRQVQALLGCHHFLAPELMGCRFPAAGDVLGEFRLLAELGRGGHGRVFLATQPGLADRPVVLKLGPLAGGEHLSLARLQHSHIVPLYSVHDFPSRGMQALCQPYFGGATLARLQEVLRDCPVPQRTWRDFVDALKQAQEAGPPAVAVPRPSCPFLVQASYAEALCWIAACLADALQYAHERGLVHLDLKPSNVLLAADGQPMLLDFHLAHAPLEAGTLPPAWLGGTPGYMAPEHRAALQAVRERRTLQAAVDGRAELYSLGLLLAESLAGTRPDPGSSPARGLWRLNPQVSPGLADVLRKCLAAAPEDRYPTAAALATDLRCHLANLPLRTAPNRSLTERWRKWRRRRPHALLLAGLLVAVALASGGFLAHLGHQTQRAQTALQEGQERLHQRRYGAALDAFRYGADLTEGLPLTTALTRRLRDGMRQAERGEAAGELHLFTERVRPLYGVELLPPEQARTVANHCRTFWEQRDLITERLQQAGPDLEQQVRTDLLDLAILWTHLRMRWTRPEQADTAHRDALAVLDQAESLFSRSCVLIQERQGHLRALGMTLASSASAEAPRTAWEYYALGRAHFLAGEIGPAVEHMERALELEPQALWPHFYQGSCAYRQGQFADAATAFSVCAVLAPTSGWCAYNRGLAHLALGHRERARQDFDHALRLDPELAAAHVSRGRLHYLDGHYADALDDLHQALALGLDNAAVHYQLALIHRAHKNHQAAVTSLRHALRQDPQHREAQLLLHQMQQDR
jgi:serine/threonine protein kinase/Flp pilus assembly protein TadD